MMPTMMANQPQRPTPSNSGRSPKMLNQSKPMVRRPKNRYENPARAAKNPMTEMRMGGFFMVREDPSSWTDQTRIVMGERRLGRSADAVTLSGRVRLATVSLQPPVKPVFAVSRPGWSSPW